MPYFLKIFEEINMIKLNNNNKLRYYTNKFEIKKIFMQDIEKHMELN